MGLSRQERKNNIT